MTDRWTVETITEEKVAKTIDHSLLKPELTVDEVLAGCELAAAYQVASVCCRPLDVGRCRDALHGSGVLVGTVVGFPHGASTSAVKAFEAERALDEGAVELDMVLPIGWLRSGEDDYVRDDIAAVVDVAHPRGAVVKVILENAYLNDEQKVRGCRTTYERGRARDRPPPRHRRRRDLLQAGRARDRRRPAPGTGRDHRPDRVRRPRRGRRPGRGRGRRAAGRPRAGGGGRGRGARAVR
jgi:deoxyribose-phosphate aldolase